MTTETKEKYQEAKRLISEENMTVKDACEKAGLSMPTFYSAKSNGKTKKRAKFHEEEDTGDELAQAVIESSLTVNHKLAILDAIRA